MRPPDDRAGGCARQKERTDDDREDAEDRRSGPEQLAEPAAEELSEETAVRGAERDEETERENEEPGAKRAKVHELAPGDHQDPDGREEERSEVGSRAEERVERVRDRPADDASVPPAVEHDREEEAESDET
jgi:hypothetical protein